MTTRGRHRDWERFGDGQAGRFGVRVLDAADGVSELLIDRPYGDDRDADPWFETVALHYAADVGALVSVLSRLDPEREQPNGTASLHLNLLHDPDGAVRVRAEVVFWSDFEALSELTATDAAGNVVARGLSAYSLRPAGSRA
jgi:hypothetical protein